MSNKRKRFHSGEMQSQTEECSSNTNLPDNTDPEAQVPVAEELFNKKFSYTSTSDWPFRVIPLEQSNSNSKENCVKALERLSSFKITLNNLKDKLSDKDIVKWHEHTNFTNLAGGVIQACRQRFRPELCTQAWCKFYEIVSSFPLFSIHDDHLVTTHLCEAPGAFITSLNHYLSTQDFAGTWSWRATTLNPYYEGNSLGHMIDDDRFLRHSLEFWDFGVDNTGDLFSISNREKLKHVMDQLGPVQLVTADGSIDCQNVPGEQERVVSPLHYCEVLTALQILTEGGSFVIKLFTMFEYSTVCLVYILNVVFKQVNVFKPATSKSGNSEVYVICLQYKGANSVPQSAWEVLAKGLGDESSVSSEINIDLDLPETFLAQHLDCCQKFMTYQGEVIQSNLNYFGKMSEESKAEIQWLRDYCTEMYIEKYQLEQICFYHKVGRYPKKKSNNQSAWAKGVFQKDPGHVTAVSQKDPGHFKQEGTFTDRNSQRQLPWVKRLANFPSCNTVEETKALSHFIQHGEHNPLVEAQCMDVTMGKQLTSIQSSRFCENFLLTELQDIFTNAPLQRHQQENQKLVVDCSTDCLERILRVLYPAFPANPVNVVNISQHASVNLNSLQNKYGEHILQVSSSPAQGLGLMLVYIDLTSEGESTKPGSNELQSQSAFTQSLVTVFESLPFGSTVVFHLHTTLTRYTAGLLYLLYHCFTKVSTESSGSMFMDQFLVCQGFEGSPPFICEHLKKCLQCEGGENIHILEIIPITDILGDDQFVGFLRSSNHRQVQGFINTVIEAEKKIHGYVT